MGRRILAATAVLVAVLVSPVAVEAAPACPTLDPITRLPTPAAAPGVDWSGCDLAHIYLRDASLSGANLSGADLSSADLEGADLSSADLHDADLTASWAPEMNLQDTSLAGATLTGVKAYGVIGTPASLPTDWALRVGFLLGPGANLSDAVISDANLSGLHLAGANLVRASIQDSFLNQSDLAGVTLIDASLNGTDLTGVDLTGATVEDTNLGATVMEGTDFTGAVLSQISSGGITGTPVGLPTGWRVESSHLIGPTAVLQGAYLVGADLADADLSHADLTGANLTDANLDGADLSAAVLTDVVSGNTSGTPADLPPGWRLDVGELWFSYGVLRVVTDPPVPSQITIDGKVADTWGLDWVQVPPGSHVVCFGRVPGFTAPPCRTVTVPLEATVQTTGTFVPRGYLRVDTSPAVASRITVDGIPRDDWGVYTDLPAGDHEVCFGPVAGFAPPPCQDVTIVAGATANVTGTFTVSAGAPGLAGVGLLRVTTTPAVPSQITIDGEIADTWGLDWLQLEPGVRTVCFGRVEGYAEPPCKTLSVTAGNTSTVTGTFTRGAHVKVLTDPPLPATITINDAPADARGVYTDTAAPGVYVCFSKVPGYVTPKCISFPLAAGGTAVFTGRYVPN